MRLYNDIRAPAKGNKRTVPKEETFFRKRISECVSSAGHVLGGVNDTETPIAGCLNKSTYIKMRCPSLARESSDSRVSKDTNFPSLVLESSDSSICKDTNCPSLARESSDKSVSKDTNCPSLARESTDSQVSKDTNCPSLVLESSDSSICKDTNCPSLARESSDKSVSKDTNCPSLARESTDSQVSKDTNCPSLVLESNDSSICKETNCPSLARESSDKSVSKDTNCPSLTRNPSDKSVSKDTNCPSLAREPSEKSVSKDTKLVLHPRRQSPKNRFHLIKTLGEGTYGKVKLATDKTTGEHVAIKYIRKSKIKNKKDQEMVGREIQILSGLRHQHIVNIREVFERKDKIVMVMEHVAGGELYDYLNDRGILLEHEARRIFRQVVSAVHCCHQNGIVHRDLKLENIMLDKAGDVKIGDFGMSNYYSQETRLTTYCGSPLYASPEIVGSIPYLGPEVDIWSLGIILYTLVYGLMPFEANNMAALKRKILHGDYKQPSPRSEAASLISHMLTVDPNRRANMDEILSHWWTNLGYSHKPDNKPYIADHKTSNTSRSSLSPATSLQHKRGSLSSDSDVEADFRPGQWSRRRESQECDNTNTLTGTCTSCRRRYSHCTESVDFIPPGLLKLPPDVLKILRCCRKETLVALVNEEATLSGCQEKDPGNQVVVCTEEGADRQDTAACMSEGADRHDTAAVFEPEKKPIKGILKRKGKFSGGDSGCVMPEDTVSRFDGTSARESDHPSTEACCEFSKGLCHSHLQHTRSCCLDYESSRRAT